MRDPRNLGMRMYTLSLESAALGIPEQALSEGLGTHFITSLHHLSLPEGHREL